MNKPVNKIEKLIAELCPEWVEFKSLMSVFLIKNGRKDRKDAVEEGIYRFFTRSSIPMRIDSYSFDGEAIVCPGEGNIGAIHYVNEKFDAHQRTYVLQTQSNNVNTKFVYYFMATHWGQANSGMQSGSTVSSIRMANFTNFKIPIPPLAIQQEIVKILDTFTTLEAELEAELEARKKQYEYYREELLTFGDEVELKTLGDVGTLIRGNGLQKKDFVEDGVGCIHYGQIYTYYGTYANKTKTFVSSKLAKKLKKAQNGDVLISGVSENVEDICKPLGWLGDEICISGDMFAFRHNQNTKFITYLLQTTNFKRYKERFAHGAKVIRVKQDKILDYKIPIPPIAEQERIVAVLDKFDALVNDISVGLPAELNARRKQYEYYRDKLLTFQGKNNEIQ